MIWRSLLLIGFSAVAGAVAGLANSSGEQGEAFRAFFSGLLAPVAQVATAHRDGELMSNAGEAMFSIMPYYQKLSDSGRPDPVMKDCVQQAAPRNDVDFAEKMVGHPEHHAVSTVISCFLDHEWGRFCRPGGGQKIAAAGEIYFWARHRAIANEEKYKASAAHYDAETRKSYWDANGEHYDAFALSWDGPDDRLIVDTLKRLAGEGYLTTADLGALPREELRSALDGVKVEKRACDKV